MQANDIRCHWYPDAAKSIWSDEPPAPKQFGVLTTQHAASSYGLPVLVRDDGAVFGPADLPPGTVLHCDGIRHHNLRRWDDAAEWIAQLDPDHLARIDLAAAALAGGYRLHSIQDGVDCR